MSSENPVYICFQSIKGGSQGRNSELIGLDWPTLPSKALIAEDFAQFVESQTQVFTGMVSTATLIHGARRLIPAQAGGQRDGRAIDKDSCSIEETVSAGCYAE